jgi:hypothetical protein
MIETRVPFLSDKEIVEALRMKASQTMDKEEALQLHTTASIVESLSMLVDKKAYVLGLASPLIDTEARK